MMAQEQLGTNEEFGGSEIIVSNLNHEDDEKLKESVSAIRQSRDAELEALRKQTSLAARNSLFSPDGKLISPTRDEGTDRAMDSSMTSSFAELRATLNSKQGSGICLGMDDFYKQQKNLKAGDSARKGEAAKQLHSFRTSETGPLVPTSKKKQPKVKKSMKVDRSAADRAALATFKSSSKVGVVSPPVSPPLIQKLAAQVSPGITPPRLGSEKMSWKKPKVIGPAPVLSLDAFFRKQKQLRQVETSKKKETIEYIRKFSSMSFLRASNTTIMPLPPNPKMLKNASSSPHSTESTKSSDLDLPSLESPSSTPVEDAVSDKSSSPMTTSESHETSTSGEATLERTSDLVETPCLEESPVSASSTMDQPATDDPSINETTELLIKEQAVPSEFQGMDFRGFIFVVHPDYGLVLLYCTRKRDKGPHHQLCGGHIDDEEFLEAATMSEDRKTQLAIAAQKGAARELFEETGIDIRDQLHRLEPAALRSESTESTLLTCEHKNRVYFFLEVSDGDFFSVKEGEKVEDLGLTRPMSEIGSHLLLRLSEEHQGFVFETNPTKAADMIRKHSGGKGSDALVMAMKRQEFEQKSAINNEEFQQKSAINNEEFQQKSPASATAEDEEEVQPKGSVSIKDQEAPLSSTLDEEQVTECSEETAKSGEDWNEVGDAKEGPSDAWTECSSHGSAPVDLLPAPERKNFFACCFFGVPSNPSNDD